MSNRPGKIRLPTIQTPWEPVNRKEEPTLRYLVDVLRELERDKQDGADFSLSGATEGDILVANGSLVFVPAKVVPFSFGVGTDLSVTGNVIVTGNASIGGNLLATGTATVTGNTQLKGTLGVSGLTTLGGALNVSGAAVVVGNHSIGGTLTVTGVASLLGQLQISSGSVSAPGMAFLGDTDTGIYRISANTLGFATSGTERIRINSDGNLGINIDPITVQFAIRSRVGMSAAQITYDENGNERWVMFGNGGTFWKAEPSTVSVTEQNSPTFAVQTTRWDGATSQVEQHTIVAVRYDSGVGRNALYFRDNDTAVTLGVSGKGGQVSIGYPFPDAAFLPTLGQFHVRSLVATTPGIVVQLAAGASANAQSWRDSDGIVNAYVSHIFAGAFKPRDGGTSTITTALLLGHNSSGTPAAGYGNELRFQLKSSTTEDRDAGGLSYEWEVATEGSQIGLGRLTANYITTPREVMQWGANSTVAKIGFLGATRAVQQTGGAATAGAAYTATEQAMIQAAYDCLRTFGFLS
jgi:hypothetical protein